MNTLMKPEISIITVNYNGLEDTCAMIESLRGHVRSVAWEVIVVDNASVRDEAEQIRARCPYPEVTVLRSEQNLGFAGGNNLGLRAARGDYYFFLNNDTFVEEDTLHYLCESLRQDPALGVVSPKIRFAWEPRPIQFAGYTPLSRVTLRNRLIGFGEEDSGQYDTPHDTPYAHGAAMVVRREAVEQAGEWPELYFLYYEELDWSERIRRRGWRIGYDPRCTVFHKESQSTGQDSPLRTFYLTRNRLLFAWRNLGTAERLLSVIYQLLIADTKQWLVSLLRRRGDLAGATWRGVTAFFAVKNKMQ